MSSTEPALIEVRRLPELAALRLRFSDGYEAQPAYRLLAGYCPCAGCQGHGGTIAFREPHPEVAPESIVPVGNYAISIVWQRGCRTGIYTFSYLRRLCEAQVPG